MMTCKEVSTLVSMGDVGRTPLARRMAVWLHLAMCRHCRTFHRQLNTLTRAARGVADAFAAEPSSTFERAIVDRLRP